MLAKQITHVSSLTSLARPLSWFENAIDCPERSVAGDISSSGPSHAARTLGRRLARSSHPRDRQLPSSVCRAAADFIRDRQLPSSVCCATSSSRFATTRSSTSSWAGDGPPAWCGVCVTAAQRRAVLSSLPVTTHLPSLENAQLVTLSV